MIYEDYNYNKGEDLNHCPICQKAFKEGECVTEIELPKGPFLLVHKNCYNSVSKGKHENRTSSNVSPETLLKDEDKLWRYMDLAKFISILKNSTLYFSAPDGFSDIYEGAHGELKNKKAWDDFYFSFARASIITAPDNRWHKIEPEKLEDNAKRLVKEISQTWKKGVYINCWYRSEFESEAMWKMYSVNVKNAIAIQTSYGNLKKELGEKVAIKPIRYVDYSKQFIGPNEEFWCKRKSFEYEKEVRAIIHDFSNTQNSGIEISVDLNKLIQNVYISPYSPKWFQEIVVDLIMRYGYKFNVLTSSMSEIPF